MCKVMIIGDTHFGCKNDSQILLDYQDRYFEQLFEYCKKEKIETIIQTGDFFDRRKFSNNKTLYEAKRMFLDRAKALNIKLYILVGNHDIFYKNSIKINSPRLYLSEYENVTVIDEPAEVLINNNSFLLVPWICQENQYQCLDAIQKSTSTYCVGHFDIIGFEMFLGQESHEGLTQDIFSKFKHVFSGHYHHKSTKKNITFVGTPYQLTWNDYGDSKGVYILNSGKHKFVENHDALYIKINYDDTQKNIEIPENLAGKYVKIIVINKSDLYRFDGFLKLVASKLPHDIKIAEDVMVYTDSELDEEIDIEDTQSLLKNYIDKLEIPDDEKNNINAFLQSLYVEALTLDSI